MIPTLIVAQIVSFILIVAAFVAIVALARQIGVLHERVAPVGALTPKQGPEVGSKAPRMLARTLQADQISIGAEREDGRLFMIMFISAKCPICKKLIPFAKSFARAEKIELVFAGDDDVDLQLKLLKEHEIEHFPFINDGTVGRAFAVDKLPHAVLIGADGRILSRGLVNSREHLESMISAAEMGVASVQEYLHAKA